MLTIKRLLVWLLERAAEFIFGACALLFVFGPSESSQFSGFFGNIYLGIIYMSFFYLASGFIVSAFFFGAIRRSAIPLHQALIMASLFVAHLAAFAFFVFGGKLQQGWVLGAIGVLIVGLVNFLGSSLLNMLSTPQTHSIGIRP